MAQRSAFGLWIVPWLILLAGPLGTQGQEVPTSSSVPAAAPTPGTIASLPGPVQVREAVARSLPFLEKEGLAWMEERKCIACHHAPFLLWSHNEARRQGFPVDSRKMDVWTRQALELYVAKQPEYQTKKTGYVEATHLLLGQGAAADLTAEPLRTVAALLLNGQQAEGFWKYEGQGQKRPDHDANEATTLWALLALTVVEKAQPAAGPQRERALAWLKSQPRGTGNEAVAVRLVLASQAGESAQVEALVAELVSRQHGDGGWGWSPDFASDPYATGQSLYALGQAGRTGADAAVQRGWKFLLDKQGADGSWYAPTKKPTAKDNPIASYWGTAWATLGLLRTLPERAGK